MLLLQDVHAEVESYGDHVDALLRGGSALAGRSDPGGAGGGAGGALRRSLGALEARWGALRDAVDERRETLRGAVGRADAFHDDLNALIAWLTDVERALAGAKPASRVVATNLGQIEQHQVRGGEGRGGRGGGGRTDWLTDVERALASAKPASRVVATNLGQIEQHQVRGGEGRGYGEGWGAGAGRQEGTDRWADE